MSVFKNELADHLTGWKRYIPSGLTAFIPGDEGSLFHQLNPIMTFILLGLISLLLLRIAHKKRPTAKDLGFHQPVFTKRNILIIAAVFVIKHLFFYLAGKWGGVSSDATALFIHSGFGQSFTLDLIVIIASTILAPVVEATIYRGVMLRWIHDALMRRFKGSSSIFSVPALAALPVQALASSTCSPALSSLPSSCTHYRASSPLEPSSSWAMETTHSHR